MEEPGRLQSMESLSQTRLRDFTFTFHFHALKKEMATHSSVLVWRIPRMAEPGGLPSMGSHSCLDKTKNPRQYIPLYDWQCPPKLVWNPKDGVKEKCSPIEQKYSIESGKGLSAVNQGFSSFSCQPHWRALGIPNLENKSCAVGFRFFCYSDSC